MPRGVNRETGVERTDWRELHGIADLRQRTALLFQHAGEDDLKTNIPYEEGRLLSEVLSPLTALPPLDEDLVGRDWTVDMINPIAGTVEQVTVTVVGFKEATLAEGPARVFRLLFATRSTRWVCWVSEEGEVLIQGTPFGLSLQREEGSRAGPLGMGHSPPTRPELELDWTPAIMARRLAKRSSAQSFSSDSRKGDGDVADIPGAAALHRA